MSRTKRVTGEVLQSLLTGFQTIFRKAFEDAAPKWDKIATKVTSTTSIETYAWLNQIPGLKKWIGERQIKRLEQDAYTLKNDLFEDTVAVSRTAIEDDTTGTLAMPMAGMAEAAATHPDELVFAALKNGHTNLCFDGQNFFDADHPVVVDGAEVSVSNIQVGAGDPWFLLATMRAVKPIVYQERITPELESHTDASSSTHVFMEDEHLYGTRSRGAAGYSYWQLAFRSTAELTPANFEAARTAMMSLKGDGGRPLNIVPNVLVVPPSLESAAEEIVLVERTDGGKTTKNRGKAEILMTPYLS